MSFCCSTDRLGSPSQHGCSELLLERTTLYHDAVSRRSVRLAPLPAAVWSAEGGRRNRRFIAAQRGIAPGCNEFGLGLQPGALSAARR